jgi:peptidyl-prolyl cis-trans isomerase SurA
MRKGAFYLVFTFLACFLLAPGTGRAEVVDRIAAIVNDDVVTWSEIYALGAPHIEEATAKAGGSPEARRSAELEVLDVMIGRKLVEQEVHRANMDVTDADVDRALADIARQNNLERDQLRTEVERSGLAWESYLAELRENVRELKFNQQFLGPRITVRDDEIKDWYRRNMDALAGPPKVHLQVVFEPLPPDADAARIAAATDKLKAVRAQIRSGALSFADAAAHGAEPYASRKGEMGVFRKGELVSDLDGPAFALETGAISDVLVSRQGVFLLKVTERIPLDPPAFADVQEQIKERVMDEKLAEAREQWLAQARRRASVQILLEPTPGSP